MVGSFDFKKTIAAQQRRAIALINSLAEFGETGVGKRIGIIGGGIGGITLAIAAAKHGSEVKLFERQGSLIPYQKGNTQRFLHPNIYDWPNDQWSSESTRLPFLNWQAGICQTICGQLENEFIETCGNLNQDRKLIEYTLDTNISEIEILNHSKNGRRLKLMDDRNTVNEDFDSVIISIGYGLEENSREKFGTPFYWENDSLQQPIGYSSSRPEKILVSGSGDGALIDAIRASIRPFQHEKMVEAFCELEDLEIQEKIRKADIAAEDAKTQNPGTRYDFFSEYNKIFEVDENLKKYDAHRIAERDVTLNFRSPEIFSLGSSRFNRAVVHRLIQAKILKIKRARLDESMVVKNPNGTFSVTWRKNDPPEVFDRLIVRHGPNDGYFEESFREIWPLVQRFHSLISILEITRDISDDIIFHENF